MATNAAGDLLTTLGTDAAIACRGSGVVGTRRGSGQVWDVLRDWVAGSDVGDANI